MLTRALLSMALLMGLLAALAALRWWQLRRANKVALPKSSARRLVYFWSTNCAQCEHAQKPILRRLDGISLISHNVQEAPALARRWGVSTVPTTFVIAANGRAEHVNNGLASEAVLRRQLGLPPPSGGPEYNTSES